jgi:stage V sporulation protein G
MNITSVNVHILNREDSKVKAIATVILDDCFAIRGIRVIEGEKGLFIAMPSVKNSNGDYKDICHPINQETRDLFEKAIFDEYNNEMESQ